MVSPYNIAPQYFRLAGHSGIIRSNYTTISKGSATGSLPASDKLSCFHGLAFIGNPTASIATAVNFARNALRDVMDRFGQLQF